MKRLLWVLPIAFMALLPVVADASCCGWQSVDIEQLPEPLSSFWTITVECENGDSFDELFHESQGTEAAEFIQTTCLIGETQE